MKKTKKENKKRKQKKKTKKENKKRKQKKKQKKISGNTPLIFFSETLSPFLNCFSFIIRNKIRIKHNRT